MIKKITFCYKDKTTGTVFYTSKYSIFGLCFYERAIAEDLMRRTDSALSI